MKGKRGTDHGWHLVKYCGDGAIYAECKCGNRYSCSRAERNEDGSFNPFRQIPTVFYPYCSSCGARKKWHSCEVEKSNKNIMDVKWTGKVYDMSEYFQSQATQVKV